MFEYMTQGSWDIRTSEHISGAEDVHADKLAPLVAMLSANQVSYSVSNKLEFDTRITIITVEETS